MLRIPNRSRPGFTLIELIMGIVVIVILSSLVLLVVPNVLEQDRAIDGAARLQQYLMIAKSRAARDNSPRGLRFVTTGGFGTEIQYIEAPPLFISYFYPENPHYPKMLSPPPATVGTGSPRVEFEAVVDTNASSTTYREITTRNVYLRDLPAAVSAQLAAGGAVICTDPKVYFSFSTYTPGTGQVTGFALSGVQTFPDMGLGQRLVSYTFGVYGSPQPILGEPVQQLPMDIGVDFASSRGVPTSMELLFTPSGDLMHSTSEQVMLWVRNRTKPGGDTSNYVDFQQAGEQQIVAIKARSGALGVFPPKWPNNPSGYSPGQDAFDFVRTGSTGP